MPFNTYTFACFLIIVLILHSVLKNWKAQKINLLISSYIFYAAWNPGFVLLLILSTVCDWIIAKKIYVSKTIKSRKRYLLIGLFLNLGLLGYFKYGTFFLSNIILLLNSAGIDFQPAAPNIILPIGISFYTFQTLSYTLDVYRGKLKPGGSLLDYSLYVAFFPQLVAGPIVRADDFLPQCEKPRKASHNQFGWGLSLLTMGLFMKIILADTLFAPVVDAVYADPDHFGKIETWAAIFSFSGQIFCDFSGYSTCAIGVALCFGFVLPDNFKAPYAALGFKDFWQRWHISLSTWIRDYLYIGLGGSRVSAHRTNINLLLTMLIGGLWHGASWLFVLWGGLHGFYLILEKKIKMYIHDEIKGFTRVSLIIFTYFVVSLTWVFFRAENVNNALLIFNNLFRHSVHSLDPGLSFLELNFALAGSLMLVIWHIFIRNSNIESFFKSIHPWFRGTVLSVQIIIIYLFASGDDHAFIYFQF